MIHQLLSLIVYQKTTKRQHNVITIHDCLLYTDRFSHLREINFFVATTK